MRLLVSVRNAAEAAAALAGGADIIDAKEPLNGALGPVTPRVLRSITGAVGGAAPVSVALGDAARDDVTGGARTATGAGVAFVKIGFAGMRRRRSIAENTAATLAAAQPSAVILVAYADYQRADAPAPADLIVAAQRARAAGILLDTYDKAGGGLMQLMTARELRMFVSHAKSHGHVVALAGKLTTEDINIAHEAGADIVGVRGAACDGGRTGMVTPERVRALRRQCDRALGIPARAPGGDDHVD
jgi:uncharacterized protein (UPF0264 family)